MIVKSSLLIGTSSLLNYHKPFDGSEYAFVFACVSKTVLLLESTVIFPVTKISALE